VRPLRPGNRKAAGFEGKQPVGRKVTTMMNALVAYLMILAVIGFHGLLYAAAWWIAKLLPER
jgi:hypothetical protein